MVTRSRSVARLSLLANITSVLWFARYPGRSDLPRIPKVDARSLDANATGKRGLAHRPRRRGSDLSIQTSDLARVSSTEDGLAGTHRPLGGLSAMGARGEPQAIQSPAPSLRR